MHEVGLAVDLDVVVGSGVVRHKGVPAWGRIGRDVETLKYRKPIEVLLSSSLFAAGTQYLHEPVQAN